MNESPDPHEIGIEVPDDRLNAVYLFSMLKVQLLRGNLKQLAIVPLVGVTFGDVLQGPAR